MSVTHLTQATFGSLLTQPGFLFFDFSAEWCPPCKVMKPIFEHFSTDADLSHIKFCEIDVDAEPELSAAYNVSSIPTFLILNVEINTDGSSKLTEVKRWIGAQPDPIGFKTAILESAPQNELHTA
jgi:thiol-disulfide isomerase/thioredoxin